MLRPACLRAAEPKRGPLAFIVVTDTHLGYKDQLAAKAQWWKTAAEVDAAPGAFVLHLGDVVDGGREAQYPVYLEGRKLIRKPVHEIPGNHDPHELFQRHLRKDVDTFFDHEWLRVVLMNNSRPESHDGFFTPEQLAWLGRTCDEAATRGLLLLLCAHVPVHANANPDRGWFVKPAHGQAEFYALVKRHAARVLACFHGHFHNGLRGWDDHAPAHEVVFPSALYNLDRKLEEKQAAGYNPPEFRPGYTLVNIRDGVMELSYQPTGAEPTVRKRLALAPG